MVQLVARRLGYGVCDEPEMVMDALACRLRNELDQGEDIDSDDVMEMLANMPDEALNKIYMEWSDVDEVPAPQDDGRALKLAVSNIQHGPTNAGEDDSGVPQHVHERDKSQGLASDGEDDAGMQHDKAHAY